jgi:hypothetical protein
LEGPPTPLATPLTKIWEVIEFPEKYVTEPSDGKLRKTRKSKTLCVSKVVAVRGLPMASGDGVITHGKLPYPPLNPKLGERMQFEALGSMVQGPEVTVK